MTFMLWEHALRHVALKHATPVFTEHSIKRNLTFKDDLNANNLHFIFKHSLFTYQYNQQNHLELDEPIMFYLILFNKNHTTVFIIECHYAT